MLFLASYLKPLGSLTCCERRTVGNLQADEKASQKVSKHQSLHPFSIRNLAQMRNKRNTNLIYGKRSGLNENRKKLNP
jgi:hypothetical protein